MEAYSFLENGQQQAVVLFAILVSFCVVFSSLAIVRTVGFVKGVVLGTASVTAMVLVALLAVLGGYLGVVMPRYLSESSPCVPQAAHGMYMDPLRTMTYLVGRVLEDVGHWLWRAGAAMNADLCQVYRTQDSVGTEGVRY